MHKGKGCTCVCAHHNRCPLKADGAPPESSAEGGTETLTAADCIKLRCAAVSDAQLSFRNNGLTSATLSASNPNMLANCQICMFTSTIWCMLQTNSGIRWDCRKYSCQLTNQRFQQTKPRQDRSSVLWTPVHSSTVRLANLSCDAAEAMNVRSVIHLGCLAVELIQCFRNCSSWLGLCCREEHHAFWSCFQRERVRPHLSPPPPGMPQRG